MRRYTKYVLLLLSLALVVSPPVLQGQNGDEVLIKRSSSLIAVSHNGDFLVAANPDSNSVSVLSVGTGNTPAQLLAEVPVGIHPGTVAIGPDNNAVFVTAYSEDALYSFNIEDALSGDFATRSIQLANEPYGVVVSPDGQRVYVAESGAGSVVSLNTGSLEILNRNAIGGNPKGLAITASGERLYVTDFFTGMLTELDTHSLAIATRIELTPESNLSLSVILDQTDDFAFVPHTRSIVENRELTFETTVFPVVSLVDLDQGAHLDNFRLNLDVLDEPVSLPIDAVLGSNDFLYVLNASSNDISVINLATFEREGHVPTGEHPRGIAISPDGKRLFINNTLDGFISIIDAESFARIADVAVTDIPLPDEILLGKVLFNSANQTELAKNQWISCAVCHFDGGMDGRTWFFADGPRNTPSLFGSSETLPLHWSGDLDEMADVESTIRNIQAGTGLVNAEDVCDPTCDQSEPLSGRSRELDALVAYIETLNLPPNPNAAVSSQIDAIAQGQEIFLAQQTGCSACHIPPLYTDLQKHDVGTGTSELEVKGTMFDTPSLRGIYATPPYLHDGSAASLRDLLTTQNSTDQHGTTTHLTDAEIDALIAFLLTL